MNLRSAAQRLQTDLNWCSLVARIAEDDEDLTILKLKGIITVDSPSVMDQVIEALMLNTKVRAGLHCCPA